MASYLSFLILKCQKPYTYTYLLRHCLFSQYHEDLVNLGILALKYHVFVKSNEHYLSMS